MCPKAGKNPEMSLSTNRRLLLFWFLTQALFVPETEKRLRSKVSSHCSLCPPVVVSVRVPLGVFAPGRAQATDGGESGESEVESCERKLTDQGRCQPKVVGSVCWYQPSARCQRCQLANQGHCRLKVIPGHWNQPGAPSAHSEQSPAAYLEKIR